MRKIFLCLGLLLIVSMLSVVFYSCHNNEDHTTSTLVSTFSGIVTYNGTPIQSAEVAINIMRPDQPVQTSFTNKDGKYEMVAVVNGYTRAGMNGLFYDMWVKYEIKIDGYIHTYFSKRSFALVPGQHHTVNIPLEHWL